MLLLVILSYLPLLFISIIDIIVSYSIFCPYITRALISVMTPLSLFSSLSLIFLVSWIFVAVRWDDFITPSRMWKYFIPVPLRVCETIAHFLYERPLVLFLRVYSNSLMDTIRLSQILYYAHYIYFVLMMAPAACWLLQVRGLFVQWQI